MLHDLDSMLPMTSTSKRLILLSCLSVLIYHATNAPFLHSVTVMYVHGIKLSILLKNQFNRHQCNTSVSYAHLTLPTKRIV